MPPIVVTGFRTVGSALASGPGQPPARHDGGPGVAAGYVVGPDNQILNRIDVRRINRPRVAPRPRSRTRRSPIPATAQPLPVPAQGTTGGLDALDDRFFEAMVAKGPDGADSLWTAHNIRVNSSGVGSGERRSRRRALVPARGPETDPRP